MIKPSRPCAAIPTCQSPSNWPMPGARHPVKNHGMVALPSILTTRTAGRLLLRLQSRLNRVTQHPKPFPSHAWPKLFKPLPTVQSAPFASGLRPSNSMARMAICSISSCPHTQTSAMTNMVDRLKTACVLPSKFMTQSAAKSARTSPSACAYRPVTGLRAAGTLIKALSWQRPSKHVDATLSTSHQAACTLIRKSRLARTIKFPLPIASNRKQASQQLLLA